MFLPDYFVLLGLGALGLVLLLVLLKMLMLEAPRALWRKLRKRP